MPPCQRPIRSLARPLRKICLWPASWPMNASWPNITAKNTAMTSCHHESPMAKNATQPPANARTLSPIFSA